MKRQFMTNLENHLHQLSETVLAIGNIYRGSGDWDDAVRLLVLGYDYASDDSVKVQMQINLAALLARRGKFTEAQELLESAQKYTATISDSALIAQNLFNHGELLYFLSVFRREDSFDMALEYVETAYKLFIEADDKCSMANVLARLGIMQDNRGNEDAALDYYQQAIAIADEINDESVKTMALAHIGVIHHRHGDFEEALKLHHEALAISKRHKQADREMHALGHLAMAQYNVNKHVEFAVSHCTAALKLAEKMRHVGGTCLMLRRLGSVYFDQGQSDKAQPYFERLLSLAQEFGYVGHINFAKNALGQES